MKNLKNSKVLVTGANGFIGSHLTEKLVNLEADVSVIIRKNINKGNIECVKDKIKIFESDLRDFDKIKNIVKKIQPEYIFHLAANVTVNRDLNELENSLDNIRITLNLLKSLDNYELFINTGTVEEYGNGKTPFREDQLPIPVSPYSASKISITNYCKMLYQTHGLPITTVRLFLTYGPKQKGNMLIPNLITSALLKKDFKMTKGEQTREFNYIDDIVEGYIKVASSKKVVGEIINIGNGEEYQISEVVDKILNIMGSPIKIDKSLPYRQGEAMHIFCDNSKLSGLGWSPKIDLDEGIRRTINWYKENI